MPWEILVIQNVLQYVDTNVEQKLTRTNNISAATEEL